jgi:hypothetical protein
VFNQLEKERERAIEGRERERRKEKEKESSSIYGKYAKARKSNKYMQIGPLVYITLQATQLTRHKQLYTKSLIRKT